MKPIKISSHKNSIGDIKLSSEREDRILIKGKFYSIDENIVNETFIF